MDIFLEYYGLDWLAMSTSLFAVYLLANRRRTGFLVFMSANLLWIFTGGFLMNSLGVALGNIIFLLINVHGYNSWVRKTS